jgi:hypothetical protein
LLTKSVDYLRNLKEVEKRKVRARKIMGGRQVSPRVPSVETIDHVTTGREMIDRAKVGHETTGLVMTEGETSARASLVRVKIDLAKIGLVMCVRAVIGLVKIGPCVLRKMLHHRFRSHKYSPKLT